MKRGQLPLIAALDILRNRISMGKISRGFDGTRNPRHLRVLRALAPKGASLSRKQLDNLAGASNGPELVAELRRRGLHVPCHRVPMLDRDGRVVRVGIYALTPSDRRKVYQFFTGEGKPA